MDNHGFSGQHTIDVDIVYSACVGHLWRVSLVVPINSSIADVLRLSDCYQLFNELHPETIQVGVFNLKQSLDTILKNGDRVEIYRSLIADPKDTRRRRAALANFEGGLDRTIQKQKARRRSRKSRASI